MRPTILPLVSLNNTQLNHHLLPAALLPASQVLASWVAKVLQRTPPPAPVGPPCVDCAVPRSRPGPGHHPCECFTGAELPVPSSLTSWSEDGWVEGRWQPDGEEDSASHLRARPVLSAWPAPAIRVSRISGGRCAWDCHAVGELRDLCLRVAGGLHSLREGPRLVLLFPLQLRRILSAAALPGGEHLWAHHSTAAHRPQRAEEPLLRAVPHIQAQVH